MAGGIIDVVRSDVSILFHAVKNGINDDYEGEKVPFACARTVGFTLISAGAFLCYKGFENHKAGIFNLAFAIMAFVLGHDLFKVGQNFESFHQDLAKALGASSVGNTWRNLKVNMHGSEKNLLSVEAREKLARKLVRDTFLASLWVEMHHFWFRPAVINLTDIKI